MPSDHLLEFVEVVVRTGLVALSAVTVALSVGVAVALLATRPKRVAVPATAAAPARVPAERPAVFHTQAA